MFVFGANFPAGSATAVPVAHVHQVDGRPRVLKDTSARSGYTYALTHSLTHPERMMIC